MSIKLTTLVWDESPYEGAMLLMLLAIADFSSDDEGKSWALMGTLARRARVSVRYARQCVRQFEEDGWVTCEERRGRSSIYYLHPPRN